MISKHELDENEKYLPWTELPEKVAQRRLRVRRYLRKGYTKSKIATLTKVSNMTIFRDIRWMSDNKINIIVNFKPQERIADSISLYKEVEDVAMLSLHDCSNEKLKPQFIKAAIEARRSADSLLSEIGAFKIKMEPDQGPDISKMDDDELDKYMEEIDKELKVIHADMKSWDEDSPLKEMPKGWEKRLTDD